MEELAKYHWHIQLSHTKSELITLNTVGGYATAYNQALEVMGFLVETGYPYVEDPSFTPYCDLLGAEFTYPRPPEG